MNPEDAPIPKAHCFVVSATTSVKNRTYKRGDEATKRTLDHLDGRAS